MKTTKLIALAMVALTLSFTPAMAQRGGGGGRSGGGHSSSSVSRSSSPSSSRSSFSGSSSSRSSYSSPSRSSSSSSRSSYSSPSRSSSSRSYSSPSRSSSSRSYGTPSRSSSNSVRSTFDRSSRSGSSAATRSDHREPMTRTGIGSSSRSTSDNSSVRTRGSHSDVRSSVGTRGGTSSRSAATRSSATRSGAAVRGSRPGSAPSGVRPNSRPGSRSVGYARPGRPGPLPPSSRPIRPAPYFYHPWHGYVVHCHPVFWDPLPPRPWYWPGFWLYCNSYWYDYHVTDVVVVRQYVQDTYNVDMVTYGISGDIMYAIVRDGGETYLQVYDKDDHLIAEQKIHRKYCNLVIDAESGGCWISKKHDKDPLLFLWSDGQLLIYEAD